MKYLFISFLLSFSVLYAYSQPATGLACDGTDDYAEAADNANLDFGTGNFTIEYWVKKRTATNNSWDNMAGVCKWNAGGSSPGQNEWSLAMGTNANDNYPSFNMESGTTTYSVASSTAMTVGSWQHLALVRNGTSLTIYLNGVSTGTYTLPANTAVNNVGRKLRIATVEANTYSSDAIFDEVRIWNIARTASEISGNMNAELTTYPCELVVYYKFSTGTADGTNTGLTALTDLAGGDNNATLYNFALSGSASNWTTGSGITANASTLSATAWYKDADGDLYSDGTTLNQCTQPANYYLASALIATSGDCNDALSAIHPNAIEICGNGIDEDCNGSDAALSLGITGSGCVGATTLNLSTNATNIKVITWKNNGTTVQTDYTPYNTTAISAAGGNGQGSGSTQLYRPAAVCFDAAGNLYVADFYNNRVQKYPPGSTSSTNGVTVAQVGINGAGGVFVDNAGVVWVSSFFNNTVFKFPANSTSSTTGTIVAGGNGAGSGATQLSQPLGVYVDASGYLYVTEFANNRVSKFPPGSTQSTSAVVFAGGNGSGSGATQLSGPVNTFEDVSHNFFVSDYSNNRIQRFPSSSNSSTSGVTIAASGMSGPEWIQVERGGTMYVASYNTHKILRYPAGSNSGTAGVLVAGTGSSGSGATQLNGPNGMAFDKSGNMYVADYFNNRVQEFTLGSPITSYSPLTAGSYSVEVEYANGSTCTSNAININTCTGNTWTGNSNTTWNNTANWSSGSWPTSSTDATIPTTPTGAVFPVVNIAGAAAQNLTLQTGAGLTISNGNALTINGVLANNGAITVQSGGSLVQATGSTLAGSGTYTVHRQGTNSPTRYNYWSTPVSGGTLPGTNGYQYLSANGTEDTGDDNPGPDPGWSSFSGVMTTGKGYASNGGNLASFSGTPGNGDISVPVTFYTVSNPAVAPSNFVLAGNPYPSGLTVSTFLSDNPNLQGQVWAWDDDGSGGSGYASSDYASRTTAGATSGGNGNNISAQLASCQGFMVKVANSGNGGLVKFNNAQRNAAAGNLLKTEESISRIWLSLHNDTLYNEINVIFMDGATTAFDNLLDGQKRRGNAYIAFAVRPEGTTSAEDELCIAALPPVTEETIVALNSFVASEGIYTINNKATENFSNLDVYLEDRLTGSFTNLNNNGEYSTLMNTQNAENRFFLHFAPKAIGIPKQCLASFTAYTSGNELIVVIPPQVGSIVEGLTLTDLSGKTILTQKPVNIGSNVYRINLPELTTGMYIISMQTTTGIYSNKIILR